MYQTILFDLDGTLTNSELGITNSVAYALASFGIHEDPDRLTPFIGPPLIDSFMEFYHFDAPTAQNAVEKYRELFNQLYDAANDFLVAPAGPAESSGKDRVSGHLQAGGVCPADSGALPHGRLL